MAAFDYVTLAEAVQVFAERGVSMTAQWLKMKCAAGKIDGAVKVGKTWLVPRSWAENYQKDTRGRPTAKKLDQE